MQRFARTLVCRVLIALTAWTPFSLQAGMIGTEPAVSRSAEAERSAVLAFLQRAEVARQLQGFGIDPAAARERVNAMTEEELRALASDAGALPAGGWSSSAGILVLIIAVVAFIYWWNVRHPAK